MLSVSLPFHLDLAVPATVEGKVSLYYEKRIYRVQRKTLENSYKLSKVYLREFFMELGYCHLMNITNSPFDLMRPELLLVPARPILLALQTRNQYRLQK